mgnify:CR=1 FL=1
MKHVNLFEQFLNEAKKWQLMVQINNPEDKETFEETYGLKKNKSNYVEVVVDKKVLDKMIKDLTSTYGIEDKVIKFKMEGSGPWAWKNPSEL